MELAVRNKQRSLLSTMQKIVGATNAARNREISSDLADVSNIKFIYDVEGDADKSGNKFYINKKICKF